MLKPKTRVALIWPDGLDVRRVLPLPFAWLASNTDPGLCELRLFDLALGRPAPWRLEEELRAWRPEVVGVSCFAMNFPRALEALRAARRAAPEAVTVLGGQYASPWPEGALAHPELDFVLKGEGEVSFPAFLRELRGAAPDWGRVPGLVRRGAGGTVLDAPPAMAEDLDALRPPDYDFIDLREYLRRGYRVWADSRVSVPVQTARGCVFRCSFCTGPSISGARVRHFSTGYVLRWVKDLHARYGARWFNIMDDSFTFDRELAKEFCRAAAGLGIPGLRFGTPNGVRMQNGDPELWRLMKAAGWEQVVVAPESGSDRVLRLMGKGLTVASARACVREIRAAGLPVCGFFIAGFPGETPADLELTREFLKEFDFAEMFAFQPLPGSPAFRELLAAGKISRDFIPAVEDFSSGSRSYVSEELRGVNFYRLLLWARLSPFLRNPLGMLRHLRHIDPGVAARRLLRQAADLARFALGRVKP